MASALRKVWLEPEEAAEPLQVRPRPQPQRRRHSAPAPTPQQTMQLTLRALGVITALVAVAIIYTGANARIAQCAFKRQSLQQEYAVLSRDCMEMKLQVDHLAAQPRITEVAQARGLDLPEADRLHCVRVTSDPQLALLTRTHSPVPQHGWLAQSRHQLVATLDTALQRLGRGPGAPAYAQE